MVISLRALCAYWAGQCLLRIVLYPYCHFPGYVVHCYSGNHPWGLHPYYVFIKLASRICGFHSLNLSFFPVSHYIPRRATKDKDIFPDLTHRGSWPLVKNKIQDAKSLKFNSLPRGRVEYSGKDRCFVVKTGNWLTDSIKAKIIEHYKLRGKPIRFDKNPFWNNRLLIILLTSHA